MTTETFLIEAVGILGFAANVAANLLIARKQESGWIVRLAANGLWLIYGIAILSIANIISSIVFTAINVYGLRRWVRERVVDDRRVAAWEAVARERLVKIQALEARIALLNNLLRLAAPERE